MNGNRASEGEVQVAGGLPDCKLLRSGPGWVLDLPRALEEQGIENIVVDSASIEVNRRPRTRREDGRLDARLFAEL
ncbi:MAG: hypothetical protein ACRER2_03460 [Methylococcales bacterium]